LLTFKTLTAAITWWTQVSDPASCPAKYVRM